MVQLPDKSVGKKLSPNPEECAFTHLYLFPGGRGEEGVSEVRLTLVYGGGLAEAV